jgi:hypothetical protein
MGLFDKKKSTPQRAQTDIGHSASEAASILGTAPPMPVGTQEEDKAARKIQEFWKSGKKKLEKSFTMGAKPKEPSVPVASAHTGFTNAQVNKIDQNYDDFMKTLTSGAQETVKEPVKVVAIAVMSEEQAARKIQGFWRSSQNYPPIALQNRTASEVVLSQEHVHELRKYLPARYRDATKWHLLYGLTQHGVSLHTMFENLQQNEGPVFLGIKTTQGRVFGAFCSEPIHPVKQGDGYYGTGERYAFLPETDSASFLWRVLPSELITDAQGKKQERVRVQIHRATMHNDYFVSTRSDCIVLGGGGKGGNVALYIHSDLLNGYSDASSPTYKLGGVALGDTELLENKAEGEIEGTEDEQASKVSFQISSLEIWGFDLD